MKLARFKYQNKISWGLVEGSYIRFLRDEPYKKITVTSKKVFLSKVRLLVPAQPSKIICVGLNYRDHAKELGMVEPKEPIIFLKPNTSLIGAEEKIIYPEMVSRLDYEAELAVVVGKSAKDIKENDVDKYILGYTCLNDVTARDLQKRDGQWSRAKSFDTFCPVGPWLVTGICPDSLNIKLRLNDKLKQNSNTANFIFPISFVVSFISKVMTIMPGDIIATGTPAGVGPMMKNDKVEVEIQNIGILKNTVC